MVSLLPMFVIIGAGSTSFTYVQVRWGSGSGWGLHHFSTNCINLICISLPPMCHGTSHDHKMALHRTNKMWVGIWLGCGGFLIKGSIDAKG